MNELTRTIKTLLDIDDAAIDRIFKSYGKGIVTKALNNTHRTVRNKDVHARREYFKGCLKHYRSIKPLPEVRNEARPSLDKQIFEDCKGQWANKPWSKKIHTLTKINVDS